MSTAIAIGSKTLQLPDEGESYSLPLLNGNFQNTADEVNKTVAAYVAVDTSDANWTYNGGLFVHNSSNPAQRRVHCLVQMVRVAGGSFAINTTPTQVAIPIPLNYRPKNYSATRYGIMQLASSGADLWGLHVKIDKDGKLFVSTDTGTTTVAVGNLIELDLWWSL